MKKLFALLFLASVCFATEPMFRIDSLENTKDNAYKINENFKDIGVNKLDVSAIDNYQNKNSSSVYSNNSDKLDGQHGSYYVPVSTFTGNVTHSAFTSLGTGNPAIKLKTITGTTADAEGGGAYPAHGLTGAKIIGFTCVVRYSANTAVPPNITDMAGYQYHCFFDATNFDVELHATNSENILSKPFAVMIFYTE